MVATLLTRRKWRLSILEDEVLIRVGNRSNYYESLGYYIPKRTDKYGNVRMKKDTYILVNHKDLPVASSVKLTKICDSCGEESQQPYSAIIKCRKKSNGKDRCISCASKFKNENIIIPYEKSLKFTHPEIDKLLVDEKAGLKLSHGSRKEEIFKCFECKNTEKKIVANVVRQGFSCSVCSDKFPYPEKYMISVLNQLDVNYEIHTKFEWSDNRIYDFYIPSINTIVETNGGQHYFDDGFKYVGGKTLAEEQVNDKYKQEMAAQNGISEYVVIDCRYSDFEFINNSILNSKFGKMFDMSSVDWMKAHEFACKTLVKEVCILWNKLKSVKKISGICKISSCTTIRKYLKQGALIGWCDYNSKEERIKTMHSNLIKSQMNRRRKIVQLTNEINFIKEWDSIADVSSKLNIPTSSISSVCRGKSKSAGSYKWMYKEDYENYIEEQKQLA